MSVEADILRRCRTVAVVGLAQGEEHASYRVARYLQRQGYRIIPVNPHETGVLGERAYPDLASVPEPIEIVAVFRRPEHVPEVVEGAIAAGAKVVWMQQGIVNEAAAGRAREAGLAVVMDRCMMDEHRALAAGAAAEGGQS